ncbi:MAG: SprB repeat-containing protein, partial [Flavobacteriales bacterium]|nr:SprB repeat-containing protein [Flavobacteriales bacterium]
MTPNIGQLAAGYYALNVKDATGEERQVEITLTEPEPLKVFADPLVYPNGKNISCFDCFNGSIDVQVEKGTPPYSYFWQDANITTQDRTSLGAKSYEVTVTDANGCVERVAIALEQPESSDWKMGGNAGTDPETQYMGVGFPEVRPIITGGESWGGGARAPPPPRRPRRATKHTHQPDGHT